MDKIRVIRLLVYEGPRDRVELTLARSIQGHMVNGHMERAVVITAVTLNGGVPEVIGQVDEPKLTHLEEDGTNA